MRVVKFIIDGGFGNQLFQLSYILSLTKKANFELSYANNFLALRGFNLNGFVKKTLEKQNILENNLKKDRLIFFLVRIFNKLGIRCFFNLLLDSEKIVKSRNDKILIHSYFQEVSFKFVLDNNPFALEKEKIKDAITGNSCFVHIRGGDYLTKKNKQLYKTLNSGYYESTILRIYNLYKVKEFVVFTNDLTHSKKIMNITFLNKEITVRFSENTSMEEDFKEMASMKYGIMSNSTFAFWSVLSNYSSTKKIIAPNKWYVRKKYPSFIKKEWIYES